MDISFKNNKLRKQCTEDKRAKRDLGQNMAKKLKQRLDDLKAAPTLETMKPPMPGRCHELKGDRKGQFSVDLVAQWRLLFEPVDTESKSEGGVNWDSVKAIKILEIEDTHE